MTSNSIGRRRSDPVPWSWEVPLLSAWPGCVAGRLGVAGRAGPRRSGDRPRVAVAGVGNAVAGAGRADDRACRGRPQRRGRRLGRRRWCRLAAAVELTLLVATVAAGCGCGPPYGPGRRMGMATRAEAGFALGVGRLRRIRKLIRPDLYGRAGRRASRLAPPQAGQPPVDAADAAGHPSIRVRSSTRRRPPRRRLAGSGSPRRVSAGGSAWGGSLAAGSCGCRGTAPPASIGPQGSGKTLDLLDPGAARRARARRWSR